MTTESLPQSAITVYSILKQCACDVLALRHATRLSHEDIYAALVWLEARGLAFVTFHRSPSPRIWEAI